MAGEVPQSVKISLRSVLLSSIKGIKQTRVEKDYHQLTNSKLDFKKYGFQDLYEFLLAIPDVARLEFSVKDGENKVFGVPEKGVFISKHAKKAEGVPNGLNPLHPSEWPRNKRSKSKDRTVVHDKASLKVTVDSDQKKDILPNFKGLYGIHIGHLPLNCQESELRDIFKHFKSLKEVKIENSNRIAFLRFSKHADAVQAMSDLNGYKLRDSVLNINPAIIRNSVQNAKLMKDRKEQPKIDTKNSVTTNGFVSEDAVVTEPSSSVPYRSPLSLPREMKTVLSEESWETESALSPTRTAGEKKKMYGQENSVIAMIKENRGYPIHVSNFPAGTTQESLKQIFSVHGKVVQILMKEKYAFVYFAQKDEAVAALEKLRGTKIGDKTLTITPKKQKGKAKQQDNLVVGTMEQSLTSSKSSVSSCNAMGSQSPTYNSFSDGALGSGSSKRDGSGLFVNGLKGSCERSVGQNQENGRTIYNQKLEESVKISSSSMASVEKGNSGPTRKPEISVATEEKGPRHILLTYSEMHELFLKCKKPLRTMDDIKAQEFKVLVTDIVDSCHFWANIDDKSGSYKELEQIRTDLQIVEHYKRCMPVKHQLGAAMFSEDNLWYRCWCLEVTKMDQKQAKVFYLDYGNCEWISWDQFTDIHKRFWDLAPQAVPFKLAGIEVATDVSPEIINEGSKYLSALIINKVCTARVCCSSDANQPHVIEVELFVKDDNGRDLQVNEQMALTRYVREARMETQGASGLIQSKMNMESNPTFSTQLQQSERQEPAPLYVRPQITKDTHTVDSFPNPVRKPMDQKIEQTIQPSWSSQGKLSQKLNQRPHNVHENGQCSISNQNVETMEKSLPKTLQQQQHYPSYQLFEKKEVMVVTLSHIESFDAIYFYKSDNNSLEQLRYMTRVINSETNVAAKIYPRIGDIVVTVKETGRCFRVKIVSVPFGSGIGVDRVKVQSIDYGWYFTVPLSSLCELPQSLKDMLPHVMKANLAGLQRDSAPTILPVMAVNKLKEVKERKQPLQASVVKRREDGVLLVELFQSDGPSLNVQLLKMQGIQLDESLCSLFCANFKSQGSDASSLSSGESINSHHITSHQVSRWPTQEKTVDHNADNQSVHSDWEESPTGTEPDWMDTVSVPGSHNSMTGRQSLDNLYLPPPPERHQPYSWGLTSGVPHGSRSPSASSSASNESLEVRLYHSGGSSSSLSRERQLLSYSGSGSGSEGSDIQVHSSAKTWQSAMQEMEGKEQFNQEDPQTCRQEREELIQKENNLKRTLELPRAEMIKTLSLNQEKEKLERKIRIKGLENQILKLSKELKQLELEKGVLEEELGRS